MAPFNKNFLHINKYLTEKRYPQICVVRERLDISYSQFTINWTNSFYTSLDVNKEFQKFRELCSNSCFRKLLDIH